MAYTVELRKDFIKLRSYPVDASAKLLFTEEKDESMHLNISVTKEGYAKAFEQTLELTGPIRDLKVIVRSMAGAFACNDNAAALIFDNIVQEIGVGLLWGDRDSSELLRIKLMKEKHLLRLDEKAKVTAVPDREILAEPEDKSYLLSERIEVLNFQKNELEERVKELDSPKFFRSFVVPTKIHRNTPDFTKPAFLLVRVFLVGFTLRCELEIIGCVDCYIGVTHFSFQEAAMDGFEGLFAGTCNIKEDNCVYLTGSRLAVYLHQR